MLYYATPTGSEGSSGTGSKEEPKNWGISLAQTGEQLSIAVDQIKRRELGKLIVQYSLPGRS